MRLEMSDSKVWKNCVGAISNLIERAEFEIGEDGIELKAMDPSHVALTDFWLSADAFEEYEVDGTVKLGVDLDEMDNIMSRANNSDKSILEFGEEDNRLKLEFVGASNRKFTLPLLDVEDEELPDPELDFSANAKLTAGVIKEGLKDAGLVGDNVRFNLSDDAFVMSSESDTSSAEMKLSDGDKGLEELEADEESSAMYNIDYLENMVKSASSNDIVNVSHGEDLPIEFVFDIAEGDGRLRFLLAPRVEAE